MTADDLHAAVDEMATDGLTGFVLLTFCKPDRMFVGSSVDDHDIVIMALEKALEAARQGKREALN